MGVCDVPLMDAVCDAVSGAGSALTDGIGAWLAKSTGELAASAVDLAAGVMDATTTVDLNAGWFRDNYELLLPIGLVLTVGTFCLQLVSAAWRRDERALGQAVSGTVVGVLFAFAAISCTTIALSVVDALSAGLFQAANSSVDDAVRRLVRVNQLGAMYPMGWAVPALVGLGCAVGALLYWGVLIFRKVGILVLVALAVFAGAGGGWEAAKRWRRGWIEATATLVVSKLLMTIVFLIGVSALGKTEADDGLTALSDALAGLVVMALVLLCPYATYKFVHWAADDSATETHRISATGVNSATGAAKTAAELALRAHVGAPAPQGPATVPGAGADGVASGIDPAGGAPAEPKKTKYRYGEDPNAAGDRGQPLIQRSPSDGDRGQPLIRRPGEGDSAVGSTAGGSADGNLSGSLGPSAAGGDFTPPVIRPPDPGSNTVPPPPPGPPPAGGSAAPERWVYPNVPPSAPDS